MKQVQMKMKILNSYMQTFFFFGNSKEKKSRRHKQEHCIELDRDKMSLADFIYYLPESNPMT